MRNIIFYGFMLFFAVITPALAQPMPGQELRSYLEEYQKVKNGYEGNEIKAGIFLGYIRGLLDSLDGTALCLPQDVPMEYLMQRVTTAIQQRAQLPQEVAARMLIFEALRGQFSCRH